MQLFTSLNNLQIFLNQEKSLGKTISFVPTMGALHSGHISLIQLAQKHADVSVCSIFVNPTQFNNPEDLIKYPRMLERDAYLLEKEDCDVLFVPRIDEIYPPDLDTSVNIELGGLDLVMEGEFRPGHFKGMLQVVNRLLDIVKADFLVMGQKDFQQFTLVQHMIQQLSLPVKLIIGETLRETDGLAMSSRNLRLTPEMREKAPIIFECLMQLKRDIGQKPIAEMCSKVWQLITEKGLKMEYLQVVDGIRLELLENPENHPFIVACIAVWAGDVRLIDNLILKGSLN
ncbi:MAG: pantoate--beta-alanine ligase [Saprospiraceae bacterium]|nr:pantoate--beta-alanine ligase [Saprospiraceae bacterium]